MARKRRGGGKRRPYLPGRINVEKDISSLGTKAGNLVALGDLVNSSTYITSIDVVWNLNDWLPTIDAGPLLIGVSHSDYTMNEIEEWIESVQSWNQGDMVAQEVSRRKIRRIGVFPGTPDLDASVLNDGKPMHTKCGWTMLTGQGCNLWIYNMGGQSTAADVCTVQGYGTAHLWPK